MCRPIRKQTSALDLVYTLFVGSLYTVDLSASLIGSFVYATHFKDLVVFTHNLLLFSIHARYISVVATQASALDVHL